MKIWAKTEEFSEGKYLVVRRDGTIPEWPHFVLGADDVCAVAALKAYANAAEDVGLDPEYVASIRELADEWNRRPLNVNSDPDAPPHRTDNPDVIRMMRGEFDLKDFRSDWQPGYTREEAESALSDLMGRGYGRGHSHSSRY